MWMFCFTWAKLFLVLAGGVDWVLQYWFYHQFLSNSFIHYCRSGMRTLITPFWLVSYAYVYGQVCVTFVWWLLILPYVICYWVFRLLYLIPLYKHVIAAYVAAIAVLPSQNVYGGRQNTCHIHHSLMVPPFNNTIRGGLGSLHEFFFLFHFDVKWGIQILQLVIIFSLGIILYHGIVARHDAFFSFKLIW